MGVALLLACGPRVIDVPGEDEGGDGMDDVGTTGGPQTTSTSTSTSTTAPPPPTATAPPPTETSPTVTTTPPPPTLDVPLPPDDPLAGLWLCEGLHAFTLEIYGVEGYLPLGEVCLPGFEPVGPEDWIDCGPTQDHPPIGGPYYFTTVIHSEVLGTTTRSTSASTTTSSSTQLVGLTFGSAGQKNEASCFRYP